MSAIKLQKRLVFLTLPGQTWQDEQPKTPSNSNRLCSVPFRFTKCCEKKLLTFLNAHINGMNLINIQRTPGIWQMLYSETCPLLPLKRKTIYHSSADACGNVK